MKKPLLLLHGAISSGRQFTGLSSFLNEEFEVHTPDFPGHGGEEIPDRFSVQEFAKYILHYLDESKIAEASVFGYSMGGYVALYLAVHWPEKISNIFTLATKLEWTEDIAESEAAQLSPQKILEKVPAFADTLREIHSPQDWKKVLEKTSEMILDLGKRPLLCEKEFQQIKIPVTVAVGEQDKMVSVAESKNAVTHLPDGQFLLLPSTPHPFEKVNQEMLAAYLNDFFI